MAKKFILSFDQKEIEKVGKKITTKRQVCSVIEEETLRRLKERKKMMKVKMKKVLLINLETLIH